MGIGIGELLILGIAFAVLVFGTIARRAGFSRWFGLLMLVPLVNLAAIWVFAFIKWPALDQATK
jgi:hypothetical protein